jgi:hypothetical protein
MSNTRKVGAVAHLDILGYQSFLDANPKSELEDQVLQFIGNIGGEVISDEFDGMVFSKANLEKDFQSLVFSDTIVLAVECAKFASDLEESVGAKALAAQLSLMVKVSLLSRKMFEFGLPVRGAIDFGDYKIAGNSFTGNALISAYRLGQIPNLACTVISEKFYNNMVLWAESGSIKGSIDKIEEAGQFYEYNVPTKTGRQIMRCLNFCCKNHLSGDFNNLCSIDLRDWVLSSFWKHGKQMDDGAELKAFNTEMFLRYCKIKNPARFW